MHHTAHSFPLHFLLPLPGCTIINDKVKWVIRSNESTAAWLCLYLSASMTFILLHCRTKMLPKQREGPVHVMRALVKTLMVCIWVELELVIGECIHCLISQPLPRKLVYPWGRQSFLFFCCISDHFMKIAWGISPKYLIKSPPRPLLCEEIWGKLGVSGAPLSFLPPGLRGNDGGDYPLGGRDESLAFFFLVFLSWGVQKEGYKSQTICPHLVAGQCLWGKGNPFSILSLEL